MNKVHDILEKIKRYQFWILCGLVTVIGVVAWWLSTSSLASTYAANKSKIESEAGKIVTVQGITPHPNQSWNDAIDVKVKEARDKVAKVWEQLYSEQQSKVYVWPKDIFGEDLVNAAAPLAESVRATGTPSGDLSTDQRFYYQNNVLRQFVELAKLLDAEYVDPKQDSGGFDRGGYGGSAAPTELLPGQKPRKVIWSGQAELQQPYVWQELPGTLAVLYAQEEIWVIKALCNAIHEANKDAIGAHDAAVKAIVAMSVGYEAAEEFPGGAGEPGRITKVTPAPVATSGYGSAEGGSGGGAYGGGDGAPGATGGGKSRPPRPDRKSTGSRSGYGGVGESAGAAAAPSDDPLVYLNAWRYVQADGTPLDAADFGSEYRLMPWRVTMTVDQAKWDELLVMFRNTDLPLEIRQVRVNPITDATAGGAYGARGGYGGGSDGGARDGGGGGRYGSGRGGYGADGGNLFGSGEQPVAPTVTLELRGFAYLLNPPDLDKIGKAGTTTTVDTTSAVPAADLSGAATVAPGTDVNPFGGGPVQPAAPPGPPPGSTSGGR